MRNYKKVLGIVPYTSRDIVGINITPRTLTCSWVQAPGKKHEPYELKAYKHLLFEVHQKASLAIYNPTRLSSLISTFLEVHDLRDAFIVIALSGDGLVEKQIMLPKPAVNLNSIEGKDALVWNYYCLQEQTGTNQAPWYTCGLKQELLFQYQLLAIKARLNVIQITTPTMALLKAYKFLKQGKAAYNKAHITDHVNLNGHIRIRSPHDHAAVVESFGLYLLGEHMYAKH